MALDGLELYIVFDGSIPAIGKHISELYIRYSYNGQGFWLTELSRFSITFVHSASRDFLSWNGLTVKEPSSDQACSAMPQYRHGRRSALARAQYHTSVLD
jgi:hypothetical protein